MRDGEKRTIGADQVPDPELFEGELIDTLSHFLGENRQVLQEAGVREVFLTGSMESKQPDTKRRSDIDLVILHRKATSPSDWRKIADGITAAIESAFQSQGPNPRFIVARNGGPRPPQPVGAQRVIELVLFAETSRDEAEAMMAGKRTSLFKAE